MVKLTATRSLFQLLFCSTTQFTTHWIDTSLLYQIVVVSLLFYHGHIVAAYVWGWSGVTLLSYK